MLKAKKVFHAEDLLQGLGTHEGPCGDKGRGMDKVTMKLEL